MLTKAMAVFPNRGHSGPMPPVEPLIYRLYEVVQNYGYVYKAILNEKFGDGIMSAIRFGTKVEKDIDEEGNPWVVITMRGKWQVPLPIRFSKGLVSNCNLSGSPPTDSRMEAGGVVPWDMGRWYNPVYCL